MTTTRRSDLSVTAKTRRIILNKAIDLPPQKKLNNKVKTAENRAISRLSAVLLLFVKANFAANYLFFYDFKIVLFKRHREQKLLFADGKLHAEIIIVLIRPDYRT